MAPLVKPIFEENGHNGINVYFVPRQKNQNLIYN
jgi:hypothetical protein